MKKKKILSLTFSFVFVLSLLVSASDKPSKTHPPMPDNVKAVIEKSCFGCHNTGSKNDKAKEALDFKKMDKLSKIKKIGAYKEIGETIEENEMPPKKFLDRYPDKKLSADEKELLMKWAKKEAEALVKGS
jgi:hypothetical protein